jgi:signal-transduction protein with cAMP-binding, CBS, and nucleotidyltransferase domain
MKIKDRIEFKSKAPVITFSPEDTVISAVKVMAEKNYGASVIIDRSRKPIGIITERDFMRRVLAKGLDPTQTMISEIMTRDLKLATSEDQVVEWLRIMSNERFRHLPVVDENGVLVNLMSQGDFVSYTWPQLLMTVKDKAKSSFMDRFHLYMIVGGVMAYSLLMVLVFKFIK